jgi:hypothetical protein
MERGDALTTKSSSSSPGSANVHMLEGAMMVTLSSSSSSSSSVNPVATLKCAAQRPSTYGRKVSSLPSHRYVAYKENWNYSSNATTFGTARARAGKIPRKNLRNVLQGVP